MNPVHAVQDLPLAAMFAATLGFWFVLCWTILALVRIGVRLAGFEAGAALPLRDTLIATLSAIFALLLAFSAAGIWNDSVQARSAVQREANALENVLALQQACPPSCRGKFAMTYAAMPGW
jgi:hypothetical protein